MAEEMAQPDFPQGEQSEEEEGFKNRDNYFEGFTLDPTSRARLMELAKEAAWALSLNQWTLACIVSMLYADGGSAALGELSSFSGLSVPELRIMMYVYNEFPEPYDRYLDLTFNHHRRLVHLARELNKPLSIVLEMRDKGIITRPRLSRPAMHQLVYYARKNWDRWWAQLQQARRLAEEVPDANNEG
jgi:hypothetical protein